MSKELKIGDIILKNRFIAAPLAGYTDVAFRKLCMEYGAAMTVTEMISVKGLCYKNKQTLEMLATSKEEKPSCVQLFGSDPDDFARAIEIKALDKFDILDVNMGCPVAKVIKNDEGSALLRKPDVAAAIVKELVRSGKPITVKMRMGFYKDEDIAVPFALAMQKAGASMVTVHARTTAQLYGGTADYKVVGRVKDALDIPVAISGDITDLESFIERENYGDLYMIGRGALINPSIFNLLNGGELTAKFTLIKKHIAYLMEFFGERYAIATLRKFFAYYLKGIRGKKEFKNRIYTLNTFDEVLNLVNEFLYDI